MWVGVRVGGSASLYTLDLVLLLVGVCRVEMLKDGGVWLQVTGVTKRAVGSSLLLRGSLSRLMRSSLAGMAGKTRGIVETQKAEIKKLETTIQEAESEKKNQKKELEGVPCAGGSSHPSRLRCPVLRDLYHVTMM